MPKREVSASDEAQRVAMREWLQSYPVDPVKVMLELRAIYDRLGVLLAQLEDRERDHAG